MYAQNVCTLFESIVAVVAASHKHHTFPLYHTRLSEGRKEVCHARDSQNWLIRVKSSALVTGFVLAEGRQLSEGADGAPTWLTDG